MEENTTDKKMVLERGCDKGWIHGGWMCLQNATPECDIRKKLTQGMSEYICIKKLLEWMFEYIHMKNWHKRMS